jgi:hypothetical protein
VPTHDRRRLDRCIRTATSADARARPTLGGACVHRASGRRSDVPGASPGRSLLGQA